MTIPRQPIFSFIVDDDPFFVFGGWHLARSLVEHSKIDVAAIHVQCTPAVAARDRQLFRSEGYNVHEIERFGDGKYCNKLGQLDILADVECDCIVLLDTDMIATADLVPFLDDSIIMAKVVDFENPPVEVLREIASAAGLSGSPALCTTDDGSSETFVGNCNGGFYAVPKPHAKGISEAWRRWASWLLDNIEPLRRTGREAHVDQVSFWLALQETRLPFGSALANVNYFIHMDGSHTSFDERMPLALLHYHWSCVNVAGHIETSAALAPPAKAAVSRANDQLKQGYNSRVFWDLRYRHFPERGSGVGSRGDNLLYKQQLLKDMGVEAVNSVLDVGCGDLEVMKNLRILRYIGIDQSLQTLALARQARPDWTFLEAPALDVAPCDLVICMEVLIHQESEPLYRALIDFLAQKTLQALIVSGFSDEVPAIAANPIIFFHEPLLDSLQRTGRFKTIQPIGQHTSVSVYRCEV